MGRSRRDHPKQLASKLLKLRSTLSLTQEQMAERLRQTKPSVRPGHVSEYERGLREPSLLVLLCYARLAGVLVDQLIDDELSLPKRFS
jgi:transcriptional regulator with XRE-family HTH domain